MKSKNLVMLEMKLKLVLKLKNQKEFFSNNKLKDIVMLVDSHCHLNMPELVQDLDKIVFNAKK